MRVVPARAARALACDVAARRVRVGRRRFGGVVRVRLWFVAVLVVLVIVIVRVRVRVRVAARSATAARLRADATRSTAWNEHNVDVLMSFMVCVRARRSFGAR